MNKALGYEYYESALANKVLCVANYTGLALLYTFGIYFIGYFAYWLVSNRRSPKVGVNTWLYGIEGTLITLAYFAEMQLRFFGNFYCSYDENSTTELFRKYGASGDFFYE